MEEPAERMGGARIQAPCPSYRRRLRRQRGTASCRVVIATKLGFEVDSRDPRSM